jgi:hypothetical protein
LIAKKAFAAKAQIRSRIFIEWIHKETKTMAKKKARKAKRPTKRKATKKKATKRRAAPKRKAAKKSRKKPSTAMMKKSMTGGETGGSCSSC